MISRHIVQIQNSYARSFEFAGNPPAERPVLFGSTAGPKKTGRGIDLFMLVKDARAIEKLKQRTDKLS